MTNRKDKAAKNWGFLLSSPSFSAGPESMPEIPRLEEARRKTTSKKSKWNYEACMADAAKYSGKTEWRIHSPRAYNAASDNGWFTDCTAHMKVTKRSRWTREALAAEAAKYNTLYDWARGSPLSYCNARKKGLLEALSGHMEKAPEPPQWCRETCMAEAQKYGTRSEWYAAAATSYRFAKDHPWFSECVEHMAPVPRPKADWTLAECQAEALKYPTRSEWHKGSSSTYEAAKANGWMDLCSKHMPLWSHGWTLETCMMIARKYQSRAEWVKAMPYSHNVAQRRGWLDRCLAHMDTDKRSLDAPKSNRRRNPAGFEALRSAVKETTK